MRNHRTPYIDDARNGTVYTGVGAGIAGGLAWGAAVLSAIPVAIFFAALACCGAARVLGYAFGVGSTKATLVETQVYGAYEAERRDV